jgi:uncharacterized membrane protein YdjX (TVP38/TMEM64 family)
LFEALLESLIQSYGPFGLMVVMIIQTIIAPIPSEALLMFSGIIGISLFNIVIFGGIGLIIGSVIAFYVARLGGKPIVIKLIGEKWLNRIDKWVERNGAPAIFFTRLIPIIPFDLISYMAGITKLEFKYYLLATVFGAFPRSLILAVIGVSMKEILALIGVSLELVFTIGIIGFMFLAYFDRKGYLSFIEDRILRKITKTKLKTNKKQN